ncbi:MAG TPA: DUF4347 domain-containing protein [Kofleriaceae bacterium]|nr:DUF4347 domain-containing protein [Kofleriaceae bacterium]
MRLLVYDRTCVRKRGRLSGLWKAGARLYQRLGRIDAAHGVATWDEAFAWLATHERIDELQYWGHGEWGRVLVEKDTLDAASIAGRHARGVAALRERLSPGGLVWFRSCETFGADAGHDFAQRLAETLAARVAGHTYVIAYHQSGLHGLAPGARPDWSPAEGLLEGTPAAPKRARWSKPWSPHTVTALTAAVPPAWFTCGN